MGKFKASWRPLVVATAGACLLLSPVVMAHKKHHHHHHHHHHHSQKATHTTPIAGCEGDTCAVPFGGDDTGCLPTSEKLHQCEKRVAKAVISLFDSVSDCHRDQADVAFAKFRGNDFTPFDEEACEADAKVAFDEHIAEQAATGHCRANMVEQVNILRDLLLGGQTVPESLDALNGGVYCDSATGALIDPDGDDAGSIPAHRTNLKCARRVNEHLSDLAHDVILCHVEAGDHFEDGETFDEEACEASAIASYRGETDEVVSEEHCAACLDTAAQNALGDQLVAFLDEKNEFIYPCPPGGTTTTTVPETTTTTGAPTTTTTVASTTTTTGLESTTTTVTEASTTTTSTTVASTTTTSTSTTTTTLGSPSGAFLDRDRDN